MYCGQDWVAVLGLAVLNSGPATTRTRYSMPLRFHSLLLFSLLSLASAAQTLLPYIEDPSMVEENKLKSLSKYKTKFLK